MSLLLHDMVFAARLLKKSPAFTLAAVLTLALGVGANAAVFSIVNALILRPLPLRDSDRLVVLARQRHAGRTLSGVSSPDLERYRAALGDVFEEIGGYSVGYSALSPPSGRPEWVTTTDVTGNYFSALDLKPATGRLIEPQDVAAGRMNPIVVLGYDTWQQRYGGDPSVIGRLTTVNGRGVTIVGVAPAGFDGAFAFMRSEIYLPLTWWFGWPTLRAQHAITRLRPGVSIARAQAAIDVVTPRLAERDPDTYEGVSIKVVPERLARPEEDEARWNALASTIILTLVALVLTVSAVNVTNLLLARAVDRRAELAIRAALGAGRGRIVRQFLTEAVLLTVVGAVAGMISAVWTTRLLGKLEVPGARAANLDFHPDGRVLAFGAVLTLITGVLVGLAPALQAARVDLNHALREGAQQSTGGRSRGRIRNTLVVSQIAACFVLLIVAGLFTRSLSRAQSVDLGFEPRGVLDMLLSANQLAYDPPRGRELFEELQRRLRELSGVEHVAFASHLPMGYVRSDAFVEAEGRSLKAQDRMIAGLNSVTPSYFETLKVPIVAGRAFTDADDRRARRVAVVNQRFADVMWPGENPIGRRFTIPPSDDEPISVVGVTTTGKYDFVFEDPKPYVFLPFAQRYAASGVMHVRTTGSPDALAATIRRTVADFNLTPFEMMSMERSLEGGAGFFLVRNAARFATILGLLSLALAVIGLYGVVAYTAGQRTHEIGVRVALGATPADVARLVVGQGTALVVGGIVVGSVVALVGSRFVASFLFGVTPLDPLTFTAVGVTLGVVGLVGSALPVLRAVRINPAVALRDL